MGQEGVAGAVACSSRATGGTERGRGTVGGKHDREQAGMPDRTQKGSIDGAELWPSQGSSGHQTPTPIHSQGIAQCQMDLLIFPN